MAPATAANGGPVQAVILAAGRGRRLRVETDARPKCLVEVGGRPLIDHQLDALAALGIADVCVVTGYRAEMVAAPLAGRAHAIHNPRWAETESLYSFDLCRPWIRGPVMIINCDVLVDRRVIGRVLSDAGSTFAFDSSSGEKDEHMKVELAGGHLLSMSKSMPHARCHGENVGILMFRDAALGQLLDAVSSILEGGETRARVARAVETVAGAMPLRGLDVAGLPWIEIDDAEDLARARDEVWPRIAEAAS